MWMLEERETIPGTLWVFDFVGKRLFGETQEN